MTLNRWAILCGIAVLQACSTEPAPTIVATWPSNDEPKETRLTLGEGQGVEVQHFHENGRIHIRGVLRNEAREGVWNTYREDGLPWSQVSYAEGVKDGLFRTWHTSGNPHIEGQHTAGAPSGTWRFYGTDGQLVETRDFDAQN
ncbi:MAG: hypothetical protein L7S63_09055 [Flavobacteriales bacterium]|nr:hypothetical protein [Flavobacteriales bacterium]